MAMTSLRRLAVGASVLLALAACEDGQGPFAAFTAEAPDEAAPGAALPPAVRTVERDVEAPDAFAADDQGLWDGRPSLGGVWVAHPDVTQPERVLIRNLANGRETTGALYRRERDMPGPRLQVSADAAATLGMLAGAPAEMRVVALRREEVEVPPAAGEALASGAIEAAPLDPPATAGTAAATAAAASGPTASNRPAARPARAAPAAQAAQPAAAPAPAAPAAAAPAPVAPPAATPPAATPPAATPPAAAAPPLAGGSFVQVGIFSQESNAQTSADALRAAGMVPTVRQDDSGGRQVWRVLVGPVATASDRATLLERIREIGFADAYVIRN